MAMPRSIIVVHAGLSGALIKIRNSPNLDKMTTQPLPSQGSQMLSTGGNHNRLLHPTSSRAQV